MNAVIFFVGVAVGSVVVVGVQLLFAGLNANEIDLDGAWERHERQENQWGDHGRP